MIRRFRARGLVLCAFAAAGCGGESDVGPGSATSQSGSAGSSSTMMTPPGSGGSGSGSGGSSSGSAGAASSEMDSSPGAAGSLADAAVSDAPSSSVTDPGTEGDGMRTLQNNYTAAPEFTSQSGVPKGKVLHFKMGQPSTIYPKAPADRNVAVYVPMQYQMGKPAPVMVFQDGTDFYRFDSDVPIVLDNLIAKGSIPPIVGVFAGNGGGDAVGSERGLEYDTVSGLYAEWVDKELLPRVEKETMAQLPNQVVTFTRDPEGRATMGGSSGGAASFSMAWWHPDLFRRVIAFSGTFVNQVPASSPFPHGCWIYHDKDPYDMAAPNGLIVARCESATQPNAGSSNPGPCDTPLTEAACTAVAGCAWNATVNKPIRVWHESGTNDAGAGGQPGSYRNFDLANQRMAAAFEKRGYHYHYDHALGAGHVDPKPLRQTLPEALIWLWRGFRP